MFPEGMSLKGTSRRKSGYPQSWRHQQLPNPHPNLHPNVESSLQRSLLQPVRPSLWLMGSMCSCSRLCGSRKRSFTLSLFSSRGMQQTDGLMHCIENFACLHHLHGTIRSLYVSVYFRALGDVQQATDRS